MIYDWAQWNDPVVCFALTSRVKIYPRIFVVERSVINSIERQDSLYCTMIDVWLSWYGDSSPTVWVCVCVCECVCKYVCVCVQACMNACMTLSLCKSTHLKHIQVCVKQLSRNHSKSYRTRCNMQYTYRLAINILVSKLKTKFQN